jgi:hypothetical protein
LGSHVAKKPNITILKPIVVSQYGWSTPIFTRCDVVGTWYREHQLSSFSSYSHSYSYSPDNSLFFFYQTRWNFKQLFFYIFDNFLTTFWQFFDNFLTSFWQLFDKFWQVFFSTFSQLFDNFLTTFWKNFDNVFDNFFDNFCQLFLIFLILMVVALFNKLGLLYS